jgi:hypothetical protein
LSSDIVSEVKIRCSWAEQRNDTPTIENIGIGGHPRAIIAGAPQGTEMSLPVGKGIGRDASSDASLCEIIAVAIQ